MRLSRAVTHPLMVLVAAPVAFLLACAAINKIDPVNSVPMTPCGDASCPTGGGYYWCDLYGKCQANPNSQPVAWGETMRTPDGGLKDAKDAAAEASK